MNSDPDLPLNPAPRVWYCDHHEVPLPERHRFPMAKYRMVRESLVSSGTLSASQLQPAEPDSELAVRRVHDAGYVQRFLSGALPSRAVKEIGFPWSSKLVRRCLASVHGTLQASEAALVDGWAGNLAGGTHHAHRARGSGYCVFNDIAVAAHARLGDGSVRRILVFDVDVHQGDGTAAIFEEEPRVFTCSIHGERNFPARKARSDLDVGLPDGIGDGEYLEVLDRTLASALERSRPELAFVQGGVDALHSDRLGRMSLSHAGMLERDRRVLGELSRRGVPFVLTLGGGYAEPIEETVTAHVGTYRTAMALGE